MKDRLRKDVDETQIMEDEEIPEDIDVDEALTFPHPKHKYRDIDHIDLMDTPHKEDAVEDWTDRDVQPSDYEHAYNEATDTHATDDPDAEIEETIHHLGQVDSDDVSDVPSIEVMPKAFSLDEEEAK